MAWPSGTRHQKGTQEVGRPQVKEATTSRIKEVLASHENVICLECLRLFDLLNEQEANEWFYGHDCETVSE
jgi:hypothetical protein